VVPTVKGCNPVTGLQTSGFHLERYETKCPKHNTDFIGERFCEKCGYKWPERNYISMNPLWWDGFRAEDGTVRQFFFTEEMMRDVATALIGVKNTVPAFGFAFFSPKKRRQEQITQRFSTNIYNDNGMKLNSGSLITAKNGFNFFVGGSTSKGITHNNSLTSNTSYSTKSAAPEPCAGAPVAADEEPSAQAFYTNTCSLDGIEASNSVQDSPMGGKLTKGLPRHKPSGDSRKISKLPPSLRSHGIKKKRFEGESKKTGFQEDIALKKSAPVKEVAVGAGARIRQDLNPDSYPLDSWKDKPDAVITLYFVFHDKLKELRSKGMRDLKGHPEGMLSGIPTG